MFSEKAKKEAMKYNLQKCEKTKKFFRKVKKGLLKAAKRLKDGEKIARFSKKARLSNEGYTKLKKLCDENGISFQTYYTDCFPTTYEFSIVIRE